MAAIKTVASLAVELEKLEKYRDEVLTHKEVEPTVTIRVVGSPDIELTRHQGMFFEGLLKTINHSIEHTKIEINELMFPSKTFEKAPDGE